MTAAAVLKWGLLEPYVFRRDDDKSFPDDTVAPIRASGTTSWGADFRIAFSFADPPFISRLYAQLPGFPPSYEEDPLEMVANHRHLVVLSVTKDPVQNLFIFKANENSPSSSLLRALPPCTELKYDFRRDRRRSRTPSNATPRMMDTTALGLWCGDKGEEFVVAELTLCVPIIRRTRTEPIADICLLRTSFTDNQLGRRKWDTMRVTVLPTTDDKLSSWQTDAAIPFQRWLCWIDYHQGILFWDASKNAPIASFLWFPPDTYSLASPIKTQCSGNGGVSVIDNGRSLNFVYVSRHDSGPAYGALKPDTGFTITCHSLVLGSSMAWKKGYTITSDELPDRFQRGLPMYPRVDIDRPQVVHFLFIEFIDAYWKMSVLSVDMSTKAVVSCYLYMDGNEPLQTEDADFIAYKCLSPTPSPFRSCDFPRFCNLSRKRKDME